MSADELPRGWDVVVVGTGVAGAVGALHLARSKLRVLLVEKSQWPREKVCGGCLNAAALHALAAAGVELRDGREYARMRLACGGRVAEFPLPRGLAISRTRLDAILVQHAIRAGACFVSETRARLGDAVPHGREVLLKTGAISSTISARVVLDCGGLASRLQPEIEWRVAPRARIGVGASVPDVPAPYRAGVIHMACAAHGYVGLVRAEDGITNIAAALDSQWCSEVGGPERAIAEILDSAGFPVIENLRDVHWQGTPHLTRTRRALGAERALILGDAAGYVEPFTGEGMAWAIADAAAVTPLVREAVANWAGDIVVRWSALHACNVRARQRVCRGVSKLLRRPRLLTAALPAMNAAPALVSPISAWLNRDFRLTATVNK
ncbi:MAG TPA: FAD-dependent monooxygenase [Rhodanobacteraceae bacterium]|nr:FAD-dependent monooxygenase [Rhodanobacteraceae bacterium]